MFYRLERKFVIFAVFVKTHTVWQGTKARFRDPEPSQTNRTGGHRGTSRIGDLQIHGPTAPSRIAYSSRSPIFWPFLVRRPHSTKNQNVVQGQCPLHFVHFTGVVHSFLERSFLEHFSLDQVSVIQGKIYIKGSQTPRLLELFWVPILGASCSNKLFVVCGLRILDFGDLREPQQ